MEGTPPKEPDPTGGQLALKPKTQRTGHTKLFRIPFNRSRDPIITNILVKNKMSYMHLKCIVVISNNVYLAYKFLCDFI